MAKIVITGDRLTVELTAWEKTKAVHGDVTVPLGSVSEVAVVDHPLDAAKGLRAPGTSVPGVTKAGTWISGGERRFVLASRGERAVRITLTGGSHGNFDELVVAVEDPEARAAEIRTAAGR
ncbi:hypothetical protein HUT16_15730 [Kitasatospora sp. NA04385]|uniref:hypothetical protein n=1 Tax=Kitasatospora sp. NA04385 TaxID=2742135 RepID=UPI00159143E4|nr:hypothetical protein [Kitasatospora sp. NA04385]QKW20320.1 hypothetical protein HUT16_15730 [Kitasatospora sp. NA04385]